MTDENNPPFSFKLPNQTFTGLYVEFWQLWAKHNKHEVKFISHSYENGSPETLSKEFVYSGVFKNNMRRHLAHFSLPIHRIDTGVIFNRKYPKSTRIQDLNHPKIAIQTDKYQVSMLKKIVQNAEVVPFTNSETLFKQLLSNELDAVIAELPFIQTELSKLGLYGVLHLSDEILMSHPVFAMVAKENTALLKIINTGILNIPFAEIEALEKKWLPTIKPFFSKDHQISFLNDEENKWLKTHRNFSLGIDTSWYPFDFVDDKGQFSGIAADYIQYLSDVLSVSFSPAYERKWTDSFALFKQGKIDVMSGVIATQERKKTINFTQTYFKAPTVIVTKKDSFYIEKMKDLVGRKLALVRGFAVVELVKEDYPNINIVLVDSIIDGIQNVQNGTVDAYLGSLAVVNYEIDRQNFDDVKIAAFSPYKFEISMAVRKGLEPFISILNKSFDNMSEKQKALIANNWLAIHIETGTDFVTIMTWGLPIIVILLVIIVLISRYNKKLQIQIQQRKVAEKKLQHLASHDSLTGLSNWRNFEHQFNNNILQKDTSQKAILFLDLDGFKGVNDTYGHAQGDLVLIETARRLEHCVGNKGVVARIGGDEFVVYLFNVKDHQFLKIMCQDLINTIAKPFMLHSESTTISTSIGISIYPDNSTHLDTLIQMADKAMYNAKDSGNNTYKFYGINF